MSHIQDNNNPQVNYSFQPKYKGEERNEYDLSDDQVIQVEEKIQTKIKQNIGSGGFSIVKQVYSAKDNKFYALKVVRIFLN